MCTISKKVNKLTHNIKLSIIRRTLSADMCLYEIDVAIRLDGKTQTNFGHLITKTLSLF
jgi:hypothetical protein